jgi:hypothetical protein
MRGALSATPIRRILSTDSAGSSLPQRRLASCPKMTSCQRSAAPGGFQHLLGGFGNFGTDAISTYDGYFAHEIPRFL